MDEIRRVDVIDSGAAGAAVAAAPEAEPSETDVQDAVAKVFAYALALRGQGDDDMTIARKLQEEIGLSAVQAADVVSNLDAVQQNVAADAGAGTSAGSGVPGWLIWIGLLIGINILSAIFDWPFWVY